MRRSLDCSNRVQTEKGPQQMLTADAGFYKGSEKGLLTARNAPGVIAPSISHTAAEERILRQRGHRV
jgi:hypothetical protein